MLTALTLVALAGCATLAAAALARLVDALERRRLHRVAAEVRITEAVHGALGPIVAPTVARHGGRPWTVTIGLAPRDFVVAGRLVELSERALGGQGGPVRIVFTPRAG
jgi:hypothetical protein